jgi:outer membrane biosynthesis protein TonB
MDIMAKVPDDAEGKFPGPKACLDFYNSILDAEEKAAKEKTEEIETKPDSEAPSTEAPVQTKENKPAKPPKEKKEKVVKEEKEKKISCTTRIMMIVVDNSGISNGDIKAILEKEGYVVSDNTLAMQKNDTLKTLKYIASKK